MLHIPTKRFNRRFLKALGILAFTIGASFVGINLAPQSKHGEIVKVVYVMDGDSILVKTSQGTKQLRIWGIDAPEKGQPYAEEAKEKLKELVENKNVKVQNPKTDNFNRDLALISIPSPNKDAKNTDTLEYDQDIGSILLSLGLAWHLNPDPTHEKPYKALQEEAKGKKIGLWKQPNPQKPEDFRRKQKNNSPQTFKLDKIQN